MLAWHQPMHDSRFFQSTRGKIVTALRRSHSASAVDLAEAFGLSTNAVRQQLLALERDGYVIERSVRRGPTKPTLEYSLTAAGEALFPQRYDKMLNAVLSEVRASFGQVALETVLANLGRRAAEKVRAKLRAPDVKGRVYELAALLRENGVDADVVETASGTIELREHNCPYGQTVGEHPEVCSMIHTVLHTTVSTDSRQIESIATGGDTCRFVIAAAPVPVANPQGVSVS
ncbi:MAG: winged helix-turn-helix transcriptional regulator [Vulcanimicrobiaceae bacterium]